jgi:uridine phosphorylase
MTITGCYKGIPISIVSIGMGSANMDFFVREIRETVSGDLVMIRFSEIPDFDCMCKPTHWT